jgi:CPA2 family monovalent cation:H+ antiporter-2
MTSLKSIIAATDFSDPAGSAIERAAILAAEHRAGLTLLHVSGAPRYLSRRDQVTAATLRPQLARAHEILARQAAELASRHGIKVGTDVLVGNAVDALTDAAERADVLVLGQGQGNALKDLVLSHTAERLLNKSLRPILVVEGVAQRPYERVFVPVDFSPRSEIACRAAVMLAPAAQLHLFHSLPTLHEAKLRIYDVPARFILEHRGRQQRQAGERMAELIRRAGMDAARVVTNLDHGDAWHTALKQEGAIAADQRPDIRVQSYLTARERIACKRGGVHIRSVLCFLPEYLLPTGRPMVVLPT